MAMIVVLTAFCCLFVVTYAWEDYADYYDYDDGSEVTIGSKKILYCFEHAPSANLYWKHNGIEYHPGTNYSYLHWIYDDDAIEVTFLSEDEAGIWECFSNDNTIESYYIDIVPDKVERRFWQFGNIEETSTVVPYIITKETSAPRETTVESVDLFYSTSTLGRGEIKNDEIENEPDKNILNVLLNSLRNPFIRAEQIEAKSGAITPSACNIVFSIFILNLLIL